MSNVLNGKTYKEIRKWAFNYRKKNKEIPYCHIDSKGNKILHAWCFFIIDDIFRFNYKDPAFAQHVNWTKGIRHQHIKDIYISEEDISLAELYDSQKSYFDPEEAKQLDFVHPRGLTQPILDCYKNATEGI